MFEEVAIFLYVVVLGAPVWFPVFRFGLSFRYQVTGKSTAYIWLYGGALLWVGGTTAYILYEQVEGPTAILFIFILIVALPLLVLGMVLDPLFNKTERRRP